MASTLHSCPSLRSKLDSSPGIFHSVKGFPNPCGRLGKKMEKWVGREERRGCMGLGNNCDERAPPGEQRVGRFVLEEKWVEHLGAPVQVI